MNDRQQATPEQSADQRPGGASEGLLEATPVRVLSGAVAFVAPCLVVATAVGLAALTFNMASQEETAGGLLSAAVDFGVATLMRCWLALAITVVMTNSFLLGDRSAVVRRCASLGVVTGLIACLVLPIQLIFGEDVADSARTAMPYFVAAFALVQCLAWRAKEDTTDDDADRPSTDPDNNEDQPDGSES